MKSTGIIALTMLMALNVFGDAIKGDIMIGEWDKSFHAELHNDSVECYLITIYDAKTSENDIRKPQLDFKATIVSVIKGKKKVGQKIEFDRVSDGGFKEASAYEGELYYVFYHKAPMNGSPIQGQYYIDSQDPLSMLKYTERRAHIASQHPHKKVAESGPRD